MSQSKAATGLPGRYAIALYDLADQDKALDAVKGDLETLRHAIAESGDLRNVLRSPVISRADQQKAMLAVLDRLGAGVLTKNTIGVLCQNRRLSMLPKVIDGFLAILSERRGEVTAEVTSAVALKADQVSAVTAALKDEVGASVNVNLKVDPAVIGGLVVKVGSRVFDASLRTKLATLELTMKGVA